jgi:hypothetical protein
MKTISIFLALVNSLLAGLILAYSLSPTEIRQTEAWWSLIKIATASSVVFIGLFTWVGSTRSIRAGLMPLCSLFLVALGAATVVWTFHIVLVSGDIRFFMVLFGGSLAVQGITSLFGFANESRNLTSM